MTRFALILLLSLSLQLFSQDRSKRPVAVELGIQQLKDYKEFRKKYADTYIPKSIINEMFQKTSIYKGVVLRVQVPAFVGAYAFEHVMESIRTLNEKVFHRSPENDVVAIAMIDNKFDHDVKAYRGRDGRNIQADVYPVVSDADKRRFIYFADAVYTDRKVKLGGYLWADVKIDQEDDMMVLSIDAYFKIKNEFLDFFASALGNISPSFSRWLDNSIGQVARYLAYMGRRVSLTYWNEWKDQ